MRVLLPMFVVLALSTGLFGACPIAIAQTPAPIPNETPETHPWTDEQRDKVLKHIERENRKIDYTVPHSKLKDAIKEFAREPLSSFNDLRILAISVPPDAVRMNLDYAETHDLDPDLVEIFRRVVAWAEDLRANDGAAVWKQAEIEAKRNLHDTDDHVVWHLRHMAIDKKYPPALHQYGLELLAKAGDDPEPLGALWAFEDAAHQHYEPSIRQLIDFFIAATHFGKHRGVAYYWFRRGELRGYDMGRWRSWMAKNVTGQDRAWAEKYLQAKTYPPDWDYMY